MIILTLSALCIGVLISLCIFVYVIQKLQEQIENIKGQSYEVKNSLDLILISLNGKTSSTKKCKILETNEQPKQVKRKEK